jgi:RNA polymerase sigma-70 factor (ECF subfamily)
MAVPLFSIRWGLPFCFLINNRPGYDCSPEIKPVAGPDIHTSFQGIPDEKVFAELFKGYYARLCLFAFRIIRNKQASEDLVQDCFVKLWQLKARVDWTKDIMPYLYQMVRNGSYNYLRDLDIMDDVDKENDIIDNHNLVQQVIEAETLHEIYLAIQSLPPKCGDIFKALFLEGKEVKEISRDLNITESTIRSHKATALALLRHKLGHILLLKYFFLI